ncbi:MAG: rRNA maturation RNase YbeY [Cyanobacteriota bacterium]|jgi:probable rRNA maturation factor
MSLDRPPGLDLSLSAGGEEDRLEEVWHHHLSAWLNDLAPDLPPPLQAGSYSLGLTLCDDAEISALNAEWRGQPGPTDVLAFAVQDAPIPLPRTPLEPDPQQAGALPEGLPLELGDIVISLDTARRQAETEGHSLSRELLVLASHGLLHLLGWDHPDAPSLAAMLARQEQLLDATAHLPEVSIASCDPGTTG